MQWTDFRNAFCAYHIPNGHGLMKRKLKEFLALRQGSSNVHEYSRKFNYLAQYASYHADTDEKKKDCFRKDLNTKLQEYLALHNGGNFNDLVSVTIVQEDAIRAHENDKKRRNVLGSSSGASPKYWLAITSLTGQRFCASLPHGGGHRPQPPQHQGGSHRPNQ